METGITMRHEPRRNVLIGVNLYAICFLLCYPYCQPITAQSRPNILWINCDDLGRELACYEHPVVQTPHIDQLAKEGVLYTHAYANAPVCSPSRSSLITGMYPTRINCQDHRPIHVTTLPEGVQPITSLFKAAGYFVSNGNGLNINKGGKKDYNFKPDIQYDGTHWGQRAEGQPFFAQIQIRYPHRPFARDIRRPIDPDEVELPACYPDHPLLRADWAHYLETVQLCDSIVGQILKRLEADGLADNTIIFFFGDHGRPHLRDKQFLYEGGLQIPLIVRWPSSLQAKKADHRLVSLVDVAATSLDLAGIAVPRHLHGKVFLGKRAERRRYVFGFRQRAGDAQDAIRSITDGRYKLIWNQAPHRPWMQLSSYKRLRYPAFTLYHVLYQKDELPFPFTLLMADERPEFEFYDLKHDPMEFSNLSSSPAYTRAFNRLKTTLLDSLRQFDPFILIESPEDIQKAQSSSRLYFEQHIQQANLPENIDDEQLLHYWYMQLLHRPYPPQTSEEK